MVPENHAAMRDLPIQTRSQALIDPQWGWVKRLSPLHLFVCTI